MKAKFIYLLVVLVTAVSCSVAAEEKSKALTNADVIKMLENKLPENVILAKIKASDVKFDTSTDAIIELHNKGVTEKILNAMLSPMAGSAGTAQSPDPRPSPEVKQPEQLAPLPPPTPSEVSTGPSYGMATARVKKGVTTQVEIMELFGAPSVMTTDRDGTEVWMYDKTTSTVTGSGKFRGSEERQSEASAMAAFLGIPLIGGVGGAKARGKEQTEQESQTEYGRTTSITTFTFIIKFNPDKTVKDYSVRQAKY